MTLLAVRTGDEALVRRLLPEWRGANSPHARFHGRRIGDATGFAELHGVSLEILGHGRVIATVHALLDVEHTCEKRFRLSGLRLPCRA